MLHKRLARLCELKPDENARQVVLLTKRCRTCFAYDPSEQFGCCYNARGDQPR